MKVKLFHNEGSRWYEEISTDETSWQILTLRLEDFISQDNKTIKIFQIIQQWDNHIMIFYDDITTKEPMEL